MIGIGGVHIALARETHAHSTHRCAALKLHTAANYAKRAAEAHVEHRVAEHATAALAVIAVGNDAVLIVAAGLGCLVGVGVGGLGAFLIVNGNPVVAADVASLHVVERGLGAHLSSFPPDDDLGAGRALGGVNGCHGTHAERVRHDGVTIEVHLVVGKVKLHEVAVERTSRGGLVVGERGLAGVARHVDFGIVSRHGAVRLNAMHLEGDVALALGHVAECPLDLQIVGRRCVLHKVHGDDRRGGSEHLGGLDLSERLGVRRDVEFAPRVVLHEHLVAVALAVLHATRCIVGEAPATGGAHKLTVALVATILVKHRAIDLILALIARVTVLPDEKHCAVNLVKLCCDVVDLVGIIHRLGGVLVEALIHVAAHLKGELGAGVARHSDGEIPVERHTELS